MSFEKQLRKLAKQLRVHNTDLPTGLRAHTLDNLPDRNDLKNKMALTRRAALAALALTGIGLVAAPRLFVSPAAASVQEAIGRTQTWHFVGWRLKNGQKLKWEIWGRRAPFFYREQVGQDVILDDGKRRMHFSTPIPADKFQVAQKGFALIRRSAGANTETLSDARAGFMAGIGSDPARWRTDKIQGNQQILEAEVEYLGQTRYKDTARLEVDAASKLPQRYSITRTERDASEKILKAPALQAELSAHYNILLPAGIDAIPTSTEDIFVLDMTTACTAPEAKQENADSKNGLTLVGEAKVRDSEGCLLINFDYWLGDTKVDERLAHRSFSLDLPRASGVVVGIDDLGRRYGALLMGTYDERTYYLCPEEPYLPGEARPKTIKLFLAVQLSTYERIGNSGRSIKVLAEDLELNVVLPEQEGTLDWDNPKNFRNHVGPHRNFAAEKAQLRGLMYHTVPLYLNAAGKYTPVGKIQPGDEEKRRKRSAYWLEKAAEAADRIAGSKQAFGSNFRKNPESREKRP